MNTPSSPIGLYRRDITDPERLVATTVSRSHLIDEVLDKLSRRVSKKSGQNQLFIGPRGIGKTHLLSLLQQGIIGNEMLNKYYCIVRFPEESNRVLSFADLLLGLVEHLAATDESTDWQSLYQDIATEEEDGRLIDKVLPRLAGWSQKSGKTLLLMLENLDTLLTQQIKKMQDIHRLRRFLMDNSYVILIATSPGFFPGLNDVKHPLYDFFDIQLIDELSPQQTLELIQVHLRWDRHDNLLAQFSWLKSRILAMHTLTGGNPRLIMMLYELIVQENLTEIKTRFHQLLDRITPFYQDRIKELPPQERALLETLALMRTQQRTPVNIAARFRKSRHQTSTLFKRMTEAGYLSVSPNPEDKRSRLYRIKEGFFDIWLAMNQSRAQHRHLPYLVEFFTVWYARLEEREQKRQQLQDTLKNLPSTKRENTFEVLDYLAEAADGKDEKYQSKVELAVQHLKLGHRHQAQTLWQEGLQVAIQPQGLMVWAGQALREWIAGDAPEDTVQALEKVITYWREQRSGQLENTVQHLSQLEEDFASLNFYQFHTALLQEQLINTRQADERAKIFLSLAHRQILAGKLIEAQRALEKGLNIAEETNSYALKAKALNAVSHIHHIQGNYDTAGEYLQQALAIQQEMDDKSGEGTTLNNISQIYSKRGDYETALVYLEQSLAIQQEIGDKSGEGTTLNNISQIYSKRGDYETALTYLEQSLAIRQEIGDKSGEGRTLNNISQIYSKRGDYETALAYLEQSLAIAQEMGDKSGEGTTLNNISQIYSKRGDYETALAYLEQSLAIAQEMGDKSGEGTTLNNISQIYMARGDYEIALAYLEQSLAIRQEIGDKSGEGRTLNNISQIYSKRGDYETALAYLEQSLAIRQEIGDKSGEGTTLSNISQIYKVRGDYETALAYLEQSLAIRQEIGDKAGLCVTLFNMGHIYLESEQREKAVGAWVAAYSIAKEIQLAQALEALAGLADQLGLPGGLEGWEMLVALMETPD